MLLYVFRKYRVICIRRIGRGFYEGVVVIVKTVYDLNVCRGRASYCSGFVRFLEEERRYIISELVGVVIEAVCRLEEISCRMICVVGYYLCK